MDKDELEKVRQGIIKDGVRYYPEANLLGSGKHGLLWKEALSRAIARQRPQGQFGSLEDIQFAVEKGSELGLDQEGTFNLPANNSSFIILPDGSKHLAKNVFVKVYSNGKVHAFPSL